MRKIIHIDMDCFYAAVEMREQPSLANKPLAVGGEADHRGVLCTCNYVARTYGLRSAMATATAKRLCPELIVLPPRINLYREISSEIRKIMHQYTDIIEPLSLDEAYLDVSDSAHYKGSASLIAQALKYDIYQVTGLTASAGVASNKLLAKIASDINKPNGLYVIPPEQNDNFVRLLPIEKLFGVGKVTAARLHDLGINTCGDLQKFPLAVLEKKFKHLGKTLFDMCRAHDERPVASFRPRKSLSLEETFDEDILDLVSLQQQLKILYPKLLTRLERQANLKIHKQFIKIKFNDFIQTTAEVINDTADLEKFNLLLQEAYQRYHKPVRLLGLGVGFNQQAHATQLSL